MKRNSARRSVKSLLSLIVLNELPVVSSQWETFQPKHRNKTVGFNMQKKHTRLKSGFIVRYIDDFKLCV